MSAYGAVIIAYKRRDLVDDVLRRLREQSLPPSQIVIVDNGGDLDAADFAEFEAVQIIPRADNPGYGAAVNEALAALSPELESLLILTHDAEFDLDLAERLVEALARFEDVGAAGPVLRRASDPSRVFSAGGRLSRGGRASHRTVAPSEPVAGVDWIDGAIALFRVEALHAIGGVDETYFLYFEDVDTSWRLTQAGWRTVVVRDAVASQEPGAHPLYLGMRNMALFATRAELPRLLSFGASSVRLAEVVVSSWLRRQKVSVLDGLRGWRDGRRGRHGKPEHRKRARG